MLELLMNRIPDGELTEAVESDLLRTLPAWLTAEFSNPRDERMERAWLRRWRWASSSKRQAMEEEAGWALDEWLYWFSPQNEFWRLEGIARIDTGRVVVRIRSADHYAPLKALEWLVGKCGGQIIAVEPIAPVP
ncbi:hypothetical protein ACLB9X_33040 [Streptomyces sp. 5K101]|uniref:hypothetical protein n=1 Tax=Streptomyces sp. 5K101 TaxID=3390037 RepID=UPI003974BC0E